MKIIIAPDKFKGSLTASQVAGAIAGGITELFPEAEMEICPLADGGEGTVEAFLAAFKGQRILVDAEGPLGQQVKAGFGLINHPRRMAVIEMSAASGLTLVDSNDLQPLAASTFGTGQLIKKALDFKPEKLIIGIGGSATSDGGAGLVQALGGKLLDKFGVDIGRGAGELNNLATIDLSGMDKRLQPVEIEIASDVQNPLLGPDGAARTYGPQKGANLREIEIIEEGLKNLSKIAARDIKADPSLTKEPGAGAAGGLGFGLKAFLGAKLKSGAKIIISALDLEQMIPEADLLISGEGKYDKQTSYGKTISVVADLARRYHVPLLVLVGQKEKGLKSQEDDFTGLYALTDYFSIEESLDKPAELLKEITIKALNQLGSKIGLNRKGY